MKIVIYGLTITSAWGNGHATTYRSLVKGAGATRPPIRFIEKDVEWYRNNRDLPQPAFCTVRLYEDWAAEAASLLRKRRDADAIVIGRTFPMQSQQHALYLPPSYGPLLFYDIDTPITMAQPRAARPMRVPRSSAHPALCRLPQLYRRPRMSAELEQRFGSQRRFRFIARSIPTFISHAPRVRSIACDLSYLGTYAADRQPKLMLAAQRHCAADA